MSLNPSFYFLSPVEVIKVTPQNLEEVAEWCGGRVAETPSRRRPDTMDKYVWVPTPEGSKITNAFPGMFITKRIVVTTKNEFKVTYAVFRKDYFDANYFGSPSEALEATWGKKDPKMFKKNKEVAMKVPAPVVNIFVASGENADEMAADIKQKIDALRPEAEKQEEIGRDAAL